MYMTSAQSQSNKKPSRSLSCIKNNHNYNKQEECSYHIPSASIHDRQRWQTKQNLSSHYSSADSSFSVALLHRKKKRKKRPVKHVSHHLLSFKTMSTWSMISYKPSTPSLKEKNNTEYKYNQASSKDESSHSKTLTP